jgi:hexosaminidase
MPSLDSKIYKKPFYSKENIQINCATLNGIETNTNVSVDSFIYHQAIGKISKINVPYSKYHPAYSGGGPMALADGRIGDKNNLKNGRWQGYSGSDLIIDLNFESVIKMNYFKMSFYENTPSWVFLPEQIQLLISEDGINYKDTIFFEIELTEIDKNGEPQSIAYSKDGFSKRAIEEGDFKNKKVRKLKVICKYFGPLPKGHPGEGYPSMIFADEIIVK